MNNIFDQDIPNIDGVRPSQILAGEAKASAEFRAKELMLIKPSKESTQEEVTKYQERLKLLGFVLGEAEDDLFLHATFPVGWTKDYNSQDPRHITIKDDKGRERISIFYKNTYYDRYASCSFNYRFSVNNQYIDEQGKDTSSYNNSGFYRVFCDLVEGWQQPKELFRSKTLVTYQQGQYEENRKLEALANEEIKAYTEQHFPDYKDPLAYWD